MPEKRTNSAADARPLGRPGSFRADPRPAPVARMIRAQARFETKLLLRNGEQLLLAIVIPAMMLIAFAAEPIGTITGGTSRIDYYAPGIIGMAVLSTAFTSQAIATGFERRYNVLKRLGATPLPRWGLLAGKALSILMVECVQLVLLIGIALVMGWSPHGDPLAVLVLLALGTAAFSGLALWLAGSLRAEATLAAANFLFLVFIGLGGVVVPLTKFGHGAQSVLQFLPISALTNGLRDVLQGGSAMPWGPLGILAAWSIVAIAGAARFFRWE
ncbi:ABC transporter permease [Actinospica sp.]|uniref:ABC transporter permease n=1 Tax=Actinospica sp. TaxID=1872142 RepID=UPI002C766F21|nr:ABC transporter permease [Actinospica sp.]HWG28234.1 ABC transporter permease [Actinospica sp.]